MNESHGGIVGQAKPDMPISRNQPCIVYPAIDRLNDMTSVH